MAFGERDPGARALLLNPTIAPERGFRFITPGAQVAASAQELGPLLSALNATGQLNRTDGVNSLGDLDPGDPQSLGVLDRMLQVAELAGLATLAFGGIGREESIGQPFRSGGTPAPTATGGMGLISPIMQLNAMAANPQLHQVRL